MHLHQKRLVREQRNPNGSCGLHVRRTGKKWQRASDGEEQRPLRLENNRDRTAAAAGTVDLDQEGLEQPRIVVREDWTAWHVAVGKRPTVLEQDLGVRTLPFPLDLDPFDPPAMPLLEGAPPP
ncbi:MAG TPA: hypothetical protein VER37_05820 [Thermomicrobiales bacterium]|nr:hypothetical protein [Thermomicrobiales bacterium]